MRYERGGLQLQVTSHTHILYMHTLTHHAITHAYILACTHMYRGKCGSGFTGCICSGPYIGEYCETSVLVSGATVSHDLKGVWLVYGCSIFIISILWYTLL